MPTGYTAKVEDGSITELKDYILTCARAFGALVHMRDDSLDKQMERCEPSDYHIKNLKIANDELEEFYKISDEDMEIEITKKYENELKGNKDYYEEGETQNARYDSMLKKVNNWIPPTKEHEALKEFAIQQISISKSDYHKSYKDKLPERLTLSEYKNMKEKQLKDNIDYHKKGYQKEVEKCKNANKWIDSLVESLG